MNSFVATCAILFSALVLDGLGVSLEDPKTVLAMQEPTGIPVLLAQPCKEPFYDNDRTTVVQLFGNGTARINDEAWASLEIPGRISKIMSTRAEKIVYVVAQEDVSYEAVVTMLSGLDAADPDLYVAIDRYDPARGLVNRCVGNPVRTVRR